MTIDTAYANTDLDLKSETPFDSLYRALDQACRVLHYTHGEDGRWHATVESARGDESSARNAAMDILAMINAINCLSPGARAEFEACCLREFNIGFECWDTWSYVHSLPSVVVRAVAETGCSIAVTLYPMRSPDGTPKE